jgi:hypothetical protein
MYVSDSDVCKAGMEGSVNKRRECPRQTLKLRQLFGDEYVYSQMTATRMRKRPLSYFQPKK